MITFQHDVEPEIVRPEDVLPEIFQAEVVLPEVVQPEDVLPEIVHEIVHFVHSNFASSKTTSFSFFKRIFSLPSDLNDSDLPFHNCIRLSLDQDAC